MVVVDRVGLCWQRLLRASSDAHVVDRPSRSLPALIGVVVQVGIFRTALTWAAFSARNGSLNMRHTAAFSSSAARLRNLALFESVNAAGAPAVRSQLSLVLRSKSLAHRIKPLLCQSSCFLASAACSIKLWTRLRATFPAMFYSARRSPRSISND